MADELHQAKGFAITLRFRHAEIAQQLFFGVPAFLLADDHHGLTFKKTHASDDRLVISKQTISMQFFEIGEERLDVVAGVRPLGVPRNLDTLPAWVRAPETAVPAGLSGVSGICSAMTSQPGSPSIPVRKFFPARL